QWEPDRPPESDSHDEDLGPNDQKRIVKSLIAAHQRAALMTPRRPWLEDLAEMIDLAGMPLEGDGRLARGIGDTPGRQQQPPLQLIPDRGRSLLAPGTSGAGKAPVLRSSARAAGMRPDLGVVQVYGLDFASGALGVLEKLPRV